MADIKFIPGVHPTYRQQFDKLTTAYIGGEVNMYKNCACFVGNLLNGNGLWGNIRSRTYEPDVYPAHACLTSGSEFLKGKKVIKKESRGLYTPEEIVMLEGVFMQYDGDTEDGLFNGFSDALDLLRQIHESKGEIIDEVPAFTKRELKTA